MKRLLVIGIMYTMFFLIGNIHLHADERTNVKEITSLEEPTWIFQAGISKGKYHDRQDLGFILQRNKPLKVRQTNPNFKDKLTLRLLSNDSKNEESIQVGNEWVTIQGDTSLVPFIDTPYGEEHAVLEYQVGNESATKPLPIYKQQGSVSQFFSTWDQFDGEYALLQGESFQLFVPKKDKEIVRSLKDFQSLDELIAYYEDIFAMYDSIIGLDGSAVENKKSQNRYFLKADISGAGGAYYGTNWTANSSDSTKMWLDKLSWGTLHEIAHGYQAGFDNQGIFTGEVSNNLFGVQYQYSKYGKKADQVGWLFNFGKKEQVERNLYNALMKENKNYDDLDLRQKLILLTMAKQKAGNEAFAKMYQGYRKLASNAAFKKGDHSLPDLMNQYYSENAQVDFTPVFERWGFKLNNKQVEINRAKGYLAVTSLAYIVPESQLAKARALVDSDIPINSNFEIVTNQQIASLGLKGNLHIHLHTNELDTLKGGKIKLKEGNTVIQEKTIETTDINVQDVPNGVYTVEILGGKTDSMSHFSSYYAYVKERNNSLTIDVNEMKVSNLTNQTIQFLGLGDDQFAALNTDVEQNQAVFTVTTKTPHSYYAGKKYASIEVFNEKGEKFYTKEIEGTNVMIVKDTIPLKEGYKIKIYHDEIKKRLTSKATIINPMNKTNEFIMTKWGLKNTSLQNNPEENLMQRIDEEMEAIIENPVLKEIPMQKLEMKKNVWLAINMLSEPQKIMYMEKYKDSLYNE
ncbi:MULTISPECIES: putative mucin/carbohydrate-binding domain-containing protein [Bacillus cereus group]|uniref:putative mucin/carbohydrate-binding domain-containing protein n=1 Tax=Bacillus cereus group TaxID=86661 RepID=UPI0013D717AE|nr:MULTISPECIES: putative mucin/carbohydrate-binding domain-containing protein [Bacillus cereus group]MDA1653936.1 M60 family metallopeptidase [Bacillus cereus group sp. TH150LC]